MLFSGGRDSTLAALRLSKANYNLILVTVTTDHLFGIEDVQKRLYELKQILPKDTEWFWIKQPMDLLTDVSFYAPTCLPCHHSYVIAGTIISDTINCENIAFGYTYYQSSWPEQTPLATKELGDLLLSFDKRLILPVYGLQSLNDARSELRVNGLSDASLEQKCFRQVNNVALDEVTLRKEITLWTTAMEKTLSQRASILLHINKRCYINSFAEDS